MKDVFEIHNYDYDGHESPNTLHCFNGYSEIVHIPNGIQNIDHNAFLDHKEIKELYIPKSLKRICYDAFMGCNNLSIIHLPFHTGSILIERDIITLYERLFANENAVINMLFCKNSPIEELWFPEGQDAIWDICFGKCYSLKKVKLPSTIKILYNKTFKDCYSLEEINFPQGLRWIHRSCFENCRSLRNVVFPKSVEYIDPYAFMGCTNLKSIVFQDDFDNDIEISHTSKQSSSPFRPSKDFIKIGDFAFSKCPSIEEVQFPKNFSKEARAKLWYVFADSKSKKLINTLANYLDSFPGTRMYYFLDSNRFSGLSLTHKITLFEKLYRLGIDRTHKKRISLEEIQELASYFITDRRDYSITPNHKAMAFFLKTFFLVIPIEQSMILYNDIRDSKDGLSLCKELFKSRILIRYLNLDNGITIFESSHSLNWNQQSRTREKAYSHKGRVSKRMQIEQELRRSISVPITHVWSLVMDQMIKAEITEADLWSDTEPLFLINERSCQEHKEHFPSIIEKLQKNQKMSDRIPDLLSSETGNKLEQGVLRWLLMLHTYKDYKNKRKVGLCSEAELIISKINPYSLQYALLFLLINAHKNNKKKAYSIIADTYCRCANDAMLKTLEQYMEIIQRYESCKWYSQYLVRVLIVSEQPSARLIMDKYNLRSQKVIPFFSKGRRDSLDDD